MTDTAADITSAIRTYIADLHRRALLCRSDKDRFVLWREASADLNALTKHIAIIAAFVANADINPQVVENENR